MSRLNRSWRIQNIQHDIIFDLKGLNTDKKKLDRLYLILIVSIILGLVSGLLVALGYWAFLITVIVFAVTTSMVLSETIIAKNFIKQDKTYLERDLNILKDLQEL